MSELETLGYRSSILETCIQNFIFTALFAADAEGD
jgi:hypothetical protein